VLCRSGEERGTNQQRPGVTREGPNVRIVNVNQKIDTKYTELFLCVLLTVHLGIILANNQLDAQFFSSMFITILYMFRVTPCSSSGEWIVSIQHLVYVTLCRWPSSMQVTYREWRIPDVVLIQLFLLMSTVLLETCRELYNKHRRKKNCASSWLFARIARDIWSFLLHEIGYRKHTCKSNGEFVYTVEGDFVRTETSSLWRCGPTRATASSFARFLDHTQQRTTFGKTPLDEWLARRRDLYLTAHNTQDRKLSLPPGGIRTHNLRRLAAADLLFRPRGHWDRRW
jgi:hypothetical protein